MSLNMHNPSRRSILGAALAAAATPVLSAQTPRDWSEQNPIHYPDPDILVLDKRFKPYKLGNTAIHRVATGFMWAEGPAWNGVGRYLLWSDIPNNRQMRWLEEDGHVSQFRVPSGYSNGNTFDYQGRQLSCEHVGRNVVRYEYNGDTTVLADKFEGKPLNAPNDIVVHPNGDIWFTDPGYGILGFYEGYSRKMELKEAVYRIDSKSGALTKVADDLYKPNGLCFSPDYKKLYICDTGSTHYADAKNIIKVYDVADEKALRNSRTFINMDMPGKGSGLADGIRADTEGNIWVGSGWVGPGYDGVQVFAPDGTRIGMILLPDICANVCFGGSKRNRLFMAAGQSVYAVYVGTQGAHIC